MLKRIGVAQDRRRNFHGDRIHTQFDDSLVWHWQELYRKASARTPELCRRVAEYYEPQVRLFGYSLVDLSRLENTDVIQPFLLADEWLP